MRRLSPGPGAQKVLKKGEFCHIAAVRGTHHETQIPSRMELRRSGKNSPGGKHRVLNPSLCIPPLASFLYLLLLITLAKRPFGARLCPCRPFHRNFSRKA